MGGVDVGGGGRGVGAGEGASWGGGSYRGMVGVQCPPLAVGAPDAHLRTT